MLRTATMFYLLVTLVACGDTNKPSNTDGVVTDTGNDSTQPAESEAEPDAGVLVVPPGYVHIPSGTYQRGSPDNEPGRTSEETLHRVTITRDFFMKSTEVTQDEWAALMAANPSGFRACGGACPVENITWYMALAYANAVSVQEGLKPCYLEPQFNTTYESVDAQSNRAPIWESGPECEGYRLPTEAEWEYAARAGATTAFHNGSLTDQGCEDTGLDAIAWYCGNSDNMTHPVAQKEPNAWGIYDVAGNVWEWTWDGLDPYAEEPLSDPVGPPEDSLRIQRGGSWSFSATFCRSASRTGVAPSERGNEAGLRLARTVHYP